MEECYRRKLARTDKTSNACARMLKEAYKRAMPALSISETTEYKTRVEVLEAQVQNLLLNGQRKEAEITKLRRDLTTTALLEARINKLEELLKRSAKTD